MMKKFIAMNIHYPTMCYIEKEEQQGTISKTKDASRIHSVITKGISLLGEAVRSENDSEQKME